MAASHPINWGPAQAASAARRDPAALANGSPAWIQSAAGESGCWAVSEPTMQVSQQAPLTSRSITCTCSMLFIDSAREWMLTTSPGNIVVKYCTDSNDV